MEKAVVSVLVNQSPEEEMDMRDENGVQARREMLELVWKLTKDDCDDVEASRIDARGFGPALVKPLCVLLRSDHARSPSSDSKELTGAACRVLLRLCCETAVGARELEKHGSDVVTEVLRCLEPGNNALIQETALFSVQLLAARDRRLGVRLASKGPKDSRVVKYRAHPRRPQGRPARSVKSVRRKGRVLARGQVRLGTDVRRERRTFRAADLRRVPVGELVAGRASLLPDPFAEATGRLRELRAEKTGQTEQAVAGVDYFIPEK